MTDCFDFDREPEKVDWLVDKLVPLGYLVVCLARSGHGKSYFCESLAMKVLTGEPFLGREVLSGDVLIIDQDTPTQTLESRMMQFSKVNGKPKHKLWIKSHEDLNLSNGSLYKCIEAHPSTKLIIIDTYHSVLGNFNPNSTSDSNYAMNVLKTRCATKGKTVWLNHHLTEKTILDIDDLMFGDSFGKAMGNSSIIQRSDVVFVMSGNVKGGELSEMCIRTWGKRILIGQKPFVVSFKDFEFTYTGDIIGSSDECINDLRILFYEHPGEGFKVEDIYKEIGKKHGINKIYKYLSVMEKDNEVVMERGKANQFKYFYNRDGNMPHVMVKQWFVNPAEKPPKIEGQNDEN